MRVRGAVHPDGTGIQGMIPRRRAASENAFIGHVLDVCAVEGFEVEFRPSRRLEKANGDRGHFLLEERKLVVAARAKGWFDVLVHEFSHLLQALEGLWITEEDMDCWVTWSGWLEDGMDFSPEEVEYAVRTIQACERDAERRVLAFAREYGFPTINLEAYAKGANIYLLNYEAARRVRAWPASRPVFFRNKQVLDLVPSSLLRSRYDKLPVGYLDLFKAHCTKEKQATFASLA